MKKTDLKAALRSGAKLNDLLSFGPGQDCEIFKADKFYEDDEVIYVPDVSLNEIPLNRPITDQNELDEVIGYCYTAATSWRSATETGNWQSVCSGTATGSIRPRRQMKSKMRRMKSEAERKEICGDMARLMSSTRSSWTTLRGGGGASTGIELAAGRVVNIAINHDPDAILMHRTNHPYTEHIQASVWDVDPEEVCRGRPVGLAWFSPDCKHFSKAKGAALVDRNIRGLAWIVLRWAGIVRPRVIILENVEEFVTWGPVRKGRPVKKLSGKTFLQWKSQLEALGYNVEHRELVAADYGAPTTRKRFVLIARCDGRPIVWPERTHAPRTAKKPRAGNCFHGEAPQRLSTGPFQAILCSQARLK